MQISMKKKKKMTITDIFEAKNPKHNKEAYKLSMLTAYDATSAIFCEKANVDMILVGDSLGMTIQGNKDTNSVRLDEIIYHTKMVVANAPHTFVVSDMPFLSYEVSVEKALENAGRLFQETGVRAIKMEGGSLILPQVRAMIQAGIPVMGHLGLTPQRAAMFGGFKAQAKDATSAYFLLEEAKKLEQVGCFALVLEAIPAPIARYISKILRIPTIGIGAGCDCDGQVLVFHDMLGYFENIPSFVKKYMDFSSMAQNAISQYVQEVRTKTFPALEHTYNIPEEELEKFYAKAENK